MSEIVFPAGFRLERIAKGHPRKEFSSGRTEVDSWLASKALQNQDKQLSTTTVLLDDHGAISGNYTLATSQIAFGELPPKLFKKLPRRMLPVASLAWLGVASARQGQGIGKRLLAQALRDCYEAGQVFDFVAVVLDCLDDAAKAFYRHFDFDELPGQPYRLFLSKGKLEVLMGD